MTHYRFSFFLLFICISIVAPAQRAKKIHFKSILIDTHNDIPTIAIDKGVSFDQSLKNKTHSDLQRMKEGGVDAQFFSIWCDGQEKNPYALANRQIDTVKAWAIRNPSKMEIVNSVKGIMKAIRQKKLAALLGVEGGHMIENDIQKLIYLHKSGVRYMTLTWNNSTDWATSAAYEASTPTLLHGVEKGEVSERKMGLTIFGNF